MTDLLQILPSFPISTFAALIPTIESHALTTTDLLTLHPTDLAKQTHLPIIDLRRLLAAIQACLSAQLVSSRIVIQPGPPPASSSPPPAPPPPPAPSLRPSSPTSPHSAHSRDPGDITTTATAAGESSAADITTETKTTAAAAAAAAAPAQEPQRPRPPDPLISTLDDGLDAALGGGIPTGRITELVGESGAGKTQFLLSLCLAVQLPPPRGLGKQALYISTESGLATRRLAQMIHAHPLLAASSTDTSLGAVSLDNILSTATPDLESQDHILEYQVPVLLAGGRIGLLVLDSVAANYRAEFERQGSTTAATNPPSIGSNMAARSAQLVRLGALLRGFARRHGIAVVVANQVADRFPSNTAAGARAGVSAAGGGKYYPSSSASQPDTHRHLAPSSSAAAGAGSYDSLLTSRSLPPAPSSTPLMASHSNPFAAPEHSAEASHPALLLDHQQRWFSGWGDDPESHAALKTPSLGLVWSTQISCRVALFKRPAYGRPRRIGAPLEADDPSTAAEDGGNTPTLKSWRRWMKVVFASHAKASGQGIEDAVEYEITMAGVKSIQRP